MTGPLAGIRVVDLTHFVAGPWCTMLLADLGADVIKVEPPGTGEIGRRMGAVYTGGESAIFLAFNRNKRSVAVDLKQAQGRAAAHRLVDQADVVVHNFRPGAVERLGMGAEELRARNPRLVHCAISAFGQDGPYAGRPANDPVIQALTGAMLLGRGAGERPHRMGVSLPDFASGVLAAVAITSALHRRHVTGAGATVDLSLLDTQMFAQLDHVQALLIGSSRNAGTGDWSAVHRCRDGRHVHLEGPVPELARVLAIDDEVLHTGAVESVIGRHDRSHWVKVFDGTGMCAPVNELSEVFAGGSASLVRTVHPTAGRLPLVRTPIRATPAWPERVSAPPLLGQHTAEVLGELGYSEATIAELERSAVVGVPPVLSARGEHKG
jgi:crotonobetainyl-CoA:carnitine CoA-transferase CaiB-like acyl-CoA transferase